jgi:hypothetical protein
VLLHQHGHFRSVVPVEYHLDITTRFGSHREGRRLEAVHWNVDDMGCIILSEGVVLAYALTATPGPGHQ